MNTFCLQLKGFSAKIIALTARAYEVALLKGNLLAS